MRGDERGIVVAERSIGELDNAQHPLTARAQHEQHQRRVCAISNNNEERLGTDVWGDDAIPRTKPGWCLEWRRAARLNQRIPVALDQFDTVGRLNVPTL